MNSNTFKFTLISGLLLFWNINYAQEDYDYDEEYEEVEYLSPLNDKSLGGQTLFVEELLDISGYILKSIEVYQNLPNNAKASSEYVNGCSHCNECATLIESPNGVACTLKPNNFL